MIEIYTDGSSKGNPGYGGYGVAVPALHYCYSEISEQETTNNREELKAIIHACQYIKKYPEEIFTIYSDSAYCVNLCNDWIFTWARNGWKRYQTPIRPNRDKIKNLDLIKVLYKYLSVDFPNFQIIKCPGHKNIIGNEIADALATGNTIKFNKLCEKHNIKFDS